MGIINFWKRGKLNRLIYKLKEDFQEEIRDFGHFDEGVSRKFQTMPYIMPIDLEITRRNVFGKKVSDELLAALLFEDILFPILFYKLFIFRRDTQSVFIFLRTVIEKFSFEEIKNIYETIQRQGTDKEKEILNNALSQKGIKIPQTPEEFTNMLPRYAR